MKKLLLLLLMLAAPIAHFGFHVSFETVVMVVLSLMLILQVILFQNQLRQDEYLKKVMKNQGPSIPLMNSGMVQPAPSEEKSHEK